MMKKIGDALFFAKRKHSGQIIRPGEAYIQHCKSVAYLVASHTAKPHVVTAALLHDTLRETDTTSEELRKTFGVKVSRIVVAVSKHFTVYDETNAPVLTADELLIILCKRLIEIEGLNVHNQTSWPRTYCSVIRERYLNSLDKSKLNREHLALLRVIERRISRFE